MTWECFPPLCPLLQLQPHGHGASSWTPPPPRLQETAPSTGCPFPSALQSRAVLAARSSPPSGIPSAPIPQGSFSCPNRWRRTPGPQPCGENSPRRRRPAAPRARGQDRTGQYSREGPTPPARPAPSPHLPGHGGDRTHRTSVRCPAPIGRRRRKAATKGRAALPADWSSPESRAPPIGCPTCPLGHLAPPLEATVGCVTSGKPWRLIGGGALQWAQTSHGAPGAGASGRQLSSA